MKAIFFILLFPSLLIAQQNRLEEVLARAPIYVPKYEVRGSSMARFYLQTGFNENKLVQSKSFKEVKDGVIVRIDLVYSAWRDSKDFDQVGLNRSRLKTLNKLIPGVLKQDLIEWRLYEQQEAFSHEEAEKLFHGFVIWYQPPPSEELRKSEIAYLRDLGKDLPRRAPGGKPKRCKDEMRFIRCVNANINSESAYDKNINGKATIVFYVGDSCLVDSAFVIGEIKNKAMREDMLNAIMSTRKRGFRFHQGIFAAEVHFGMLDKKFKVVVNADIWQVGLIDRTITRRYKMTKNMRGCICNDMPPDSGYVDSELIVKPDSTIYHIMDRHNDWDSMLVVEDMTGSMMPYLEQVLIWNKLNEKAGKTKFIVFFNDGDMLPNFAKITGRVDGIYMSNKTDWENLLLLADSTMRGGNGGDLPENNVEALLKGIEACPECGEIVMIADNYATPRDMSLARKIQRPVKIILCGTRGGINPAYLDLARICKGSVHTIEKDIEGLGHLSEGEIIEIGDEKFKIVNDQFVRMRGM